MHQWLRECEKLSVASSFTHLRFLKNHGRGAPPEITAVIIRAAESCDKKNVSVVYNSFFE